MNCWDCCHIVKSGMRFVRDFECHHPERREDDVRNIRLTPDELEEGCDYMEPIKPKEQDDEA